MAQKPKQELCECEQPGYFRSGLPGVLAHVRHGRAVTSVERCDACQRYASDQDAKIALRNWLAAQATTRTTGTELLIVVTLKPLVNLVIEPGQSLDAGELKKVAAGLAVELLQENAEEMVDGLEIIEIRNVE